MRGLGCIRVFSFLKKTIVASGIRFSSNASNGGGANKNNRNGGILSTIDFGCFYYESATVFRI